MKKIPVGATIAQAYRFAFGGFLKVLGIMWLPMLLAYAPSFLLQPRLQALSARIMAHDISAIAQLWTILLPFYLFVFILMCMQAIGAVRLALGVQKPAWIYFSLGKPVWRLFGNLLLLILILVLGTIAAILAGLLVTFLLTAVGNAVNFPALTATLRFVSAIADLAIWCAWFYCLVRLTFLLAPVIAEEEPGMALARAWTLGRGNFWRMFLVLLSFLLPFMLLEMGLLIWLMFHGLPFPPPHASAAQQAAYQAAMLARQTALTAGMYHYWYITFPLLVVIMVLFYGASAAAQGFSWRALTTSDE